jgi:hypothetical protein
MLRRGDGGRRNPSIYAESITMIIIGIVLSFVGLGYVCWLIFALAAYALPLFAGLTAGLASYHSGSGLIAAIAVGQLSASSSFLLDNSPLGRCGQRPCAQQSPSCSLCRQPSRAIMPYTDSLILSYLLKAGGKL